MRQAAADQVGGDETTVEREAPAVEVIQSWRETLVAICGTLVQLIPNRFREFREPFAQVDPASGEVALVALWTDYLDRRFPLTTDLELLMRLVATGALFLGPTQAFAARRARERSADRGTPQEQAYPQATAHHPTEAEERRARAIVDAIQRSRDDHPGQDEEREDLPGEATGDKGDDGNDLDLGPEQGISDRGGF